MSKAKLYLIVSIWLAGLAFSLWRESLAIEGVFSVITIVLGIIVVIVDPGTKESKRIGWRVIGISLLISGILTIGIVLVEKLVLYR
jgi:lipoprotein signal peptidase